MKNREAATNALGELMEALQTAAEVAEQTERELRAAGYAGIANEIGRYTVGWLQKFADDDDTYQPGSIGSLLQRLENA